MSLFAMNFQAMYTRDKEYCYHATGSESGMRRKQSIIPETKKPHPSTTTDGWMTSSTLEYNNASALKKRVDGRQAQILDSAFVLDDANVSTADSSDDQEPVQDDVMVKADRSQQPKQVLNYQGPGEDQERKEKQSHQSKSNEGQSSQSSKDTQVNHDNGQATGSSVSIINVGGESQVDVVVSSSVSNASQGVSSISSPRTPTSSQDTPMSPNTEMRQFFGSIIADTKEEAVREMDKMGEGRIQTQEEDNRRSSVTMQEQSNQNGRQVLVTTTITGINKTQNDNDTASPSTKDFNSELQKKFNKRANSSNTSASTPKSTVYSANGSAKPAPLTIDTSQQVTSVFTPHSPTETDAYITKSGSPISSSISKDFYVKTTGGASRTTSSPTYFAAKAQATRTTSSTSRASENSSGQGSSAEIHTQESKQAVKGSGPKKSFMYPAVSVVSKKITSKQDNTPQQEQISSNASTEQKVVIRKKETHLVPGKVTKVKPHLSHLLPDRPISEARLDSTLPGLQEMDNFPMDSLHDSIKDLDDYLKAQDPDAISQISNTSSRHLEHFNFSMTDGKSSEVTFF